jgi:hypothetical protein
MYIEHWKTKVSSLAESEPSKVLGAWGLIEVEGLGADDILPIFRASNASEQVRLGASSGSSSGSGLLSESSPGSGVSFGLSGGGWFAGSVGSTSGGSCVSEGKTKSESCEEAREAEVWGATSPLVIDMRFSVSPAC